MTQYTPPDYNCPLCPRLEAFRNLNRKSHPDFYNGPVPSFGNLDAELLIVGLAPGLKGANRTGRPFTGDYAGIILYSALQRYGFAKGNYDPEKVATSKTDGFTLNNCRVTNAVRCLPPENKPEPSEIGHCNPFLNTELLAMSNLKIIISLGLISHKAIIKTLGLKQSQYMFGHAAKHNVSIGNRSLQLINSYHTSRYNINTGTLTQSMFDDIVLAARKAL